MGSTLNDWLKGLYDGEQEKVASTSLEQQLMQLPPEELLKIATTGHMSQARRESLPAKAFAVPEKKAKKLGVASEIKGEAKGKYPIPDAKHARNALARVAQHGTPGEKAAVEKKVHDRYPGIGKESSAKLSWADRWGRALAQMEKEACSSQPGKMADFEKEDEFTSPEAQQKAKVVQHAMKATKGAPPHIRKAAVKVTAEKLKQAAAGEPSWYDRQLQAQQSAAESTPLQAATGGLGLGAVGAMIGHHHGGGAGALAGGLLGGAGGVGLGMLTSHLARKRREALKAMAQPGGEKDLDWLQRQHVAQQSAMESPALRTTMGGLGGALAGHMIRPGGAGAIIGGLGGAGLGYLGSHLARRQREAIAQM